VTIKDFGVGIHPDDFEKTIVGLGGSLKRGKHYLLGAYGWGGSQTFMWCNGAHESVDVESLPLAIIVSRKNPNLLEEGQNDEVGWTIIRYKDNPQEKHGVFQYLVDSNKKILRISPKNLPKDFEHGTCIIHLAYNLEGFHGPMTLSSYRLFQSLLFDPILPFWLYDNRQKEGRTISGNLSRLGTDDKKDIEYQNTIDQITNFGKIKIRYWALKSKKEGGYHLDSFLIKPGSSETIIITLNGQQYSALSKKIIRDAGLSFLSDYLIFQIECDSLSHQMKKNIFPSTREDIREQYKEELQNEILSILKSDEELKNLEEKRKKEHLTSGDESSMKRIRKNLDNLIAVNKKIINIGKEGKETKKKKEKFKPKDPPTILKILHEREEIKIIRGEEKKIVLETDAPSDFLTREKDQGVLECVTNGLESNIRIGFLREGKINIYLTIKDDTKIGTRGKLVCKLKYNGKVLEDSKDIEIIDFPPQLPTNYPPKIFEIMNEENPLLIKRGRRSLIQIRCDGPDNLLEDVEKKANLELSFLPDLGIKVIGRSDLVRNKIRIFIKCPNNVDIGKRTEVMCKLTLKEGQSYISKRQCIVILPPPESDEGGDKKVEIPDYEIVTVEPDDKNWIEFQWDENDVGKYMKSGDTLVLYVSLGNTHYLNTLDSNEISSEKIESFKEKYVSYIVYHLWLSYEDKLEEKIEKENVKLDYKRINQTVLLALSQDPRFR